MDLQIGSTLGDYQIIGILGAGGMGKVYKVRNVISDRVEAMKLLLPDLANTPELADRFLREIKVQASLEHPNIAALHTAVRQDNQLLMLIEFVDGVTLEQRLKQGPIPVPLAVDYIGQVLNALDFAHAHGVIHRDIKPANMMLTPNGVVKLMDFGIAKASSDHKLTMTGTTMGSLYYMSPEQIQGSANLDARADLYSVGVSLYEMVTGKRPFDGDSQFAIMSAHLEKTPAPPVTLDPRLPQALNDIILMSVAKAPDARFQTAKAFRNALSNAVAAPTLDAQPAVAAAPKRGKRGLWMAIGAVAAVVALVAVIELPPRKGIKAANPVSAPAETAQPPAPAPAASAPVSVPSSVPAEHASVPVSSPASGPPAQAPATVRRQTAQIPSQPASPPPQPQPQQQQPQQPQQAPQSPAVQPPAPAADPGPSRAELQKAREALTLLSNRAATVHNSMQSLQQSQAAQGYGLGGQYTGPAGLMDTYLRGAADALEAKDLAASKDFSAKAERQIEILEKLFHL
ncbi:MAG: serine/threonine-protein kinase [Candidatus Sulfopaludibacter sp.]|nr:serine/threonine-protein kinase [Candidatus Sulfopaludibacter sp.]